MENDFYSLCTVYHRSHRHNSVAARPKWVLPAQILSCALEYFEVHSLLSILAEFSLLSPSSPGQIGDHCGLDIAMNIERSCFHIPKQPGRQRKNWPSCADLRRCPHLFPDSTRTIILEEPALRWIGVAVSKPREFAPLIKTNLLDSFIANLVVTGQYERIDQALKYRLYDPYVKEVPRLQSHSDDPK